MATHYLPHSLPDAVAHRDRLSTYHRGAWRDRARWARYGELRRAALERGDPFSLSADDTMRAESERYAWGLFPRERPRRSR